MRVPRRAPDKARIEVIPMIDIIFFLLVFFMLSTLSMTINRGVPVNLPKAASSPKELRDSLQITMTKDGGIFLNKEPVTLQEIARKVKASVDQGQELLAIINADAHVIHGTVVDIMDKMRLAGVSRLAIAVQPERRTQP